MPLTSLRHSTQNGPGTSGATSSRQPSTPLEATPSGAIHRRVMLRMDCRAYADALPVSLSLLKFGAGTAPRTHTVLDRLPEVGDVEPIGVRGLRAVGEHILHRETRFAHVVKDTVNDHL